MIDIQNIRRDEKCIQYFSRKILSEKDYMYMRERLVKKKSHKIKFGNLSCTYSAPDRYIVLAVLNTTKKLRLP